MEGVRDTISRAPALLALVAAIAALAGMAPVLVLAPRAAAQATPPPGPAPAPNAPPVASFSFSPTAPLVGQAVTFTSTSTDSDGTINREAWDFNGDNVNDATGHVVTWTFTSAGSFTVRLRARDNAGATANTRSPVVVTAPNIAPSASFTFAPIAPTAGETVVFTSQSRDPEGRPMGLVWDLDQDGSFDDAAGPTAAWTFPVAGSFVVAHRATDDHNASSDARQTVTVRGVAAAQEAPTAPRPGSSAAGASPLGPTPSPGTSTRLASNEPAVMMNPSPIVRIRGRASGSGVVVELLSVRGPRGAAVLARCKGAACPKRGLTARAVSAVRTVRLRAMERLYRPGAVIEVYVTLPGRIGKYVRFTIRSGRAPARSDRCLAPGGTQPIRCPSS